MISICFHVEITQSMLSTVAKSAKASTMAQDGASQVSGNFHSSCESAIYVSDSKLHRGMEFKTVHDLHPSEKYTR